MNVSTDIVRVKHLTYEYPGTRALDDVSLSVARGSVTALVGPNGAGKSTLLRCIAALDQPIDGDIQIDGIDVLDQPRECHRRIGYLSDFFGVYTSLKVWQCLAHAASAKGVAAADIDAAVQRTASGLDLTPKLQDSAGALSRGQRQRLAIGQALIHQPLLLILDEPASGLDPEARHELARLFTRLRDDGMTLIVSSHILAELDQYSTHMLVLRDGKVIESRALAASGTAETAVRVIATFTPEGGVTAEQIRGAIASVTGVELLAMETSRAIFALVGDEGVRTRLIQALVMAGIPVSAVTVDRENLHESYLRTLDRIG